MKSLFRNRALKAILPLFAAVALALPYCSNLAHAQVSSQPQPFTTTAASGTLGPFGCLGATTATWTWTTGTAGTVTILGSADAVGGGTYNTNTNFGTAGVITAPAAGSVSSGNTAAFPQGIEATFTGNSGTFSGYVTCSGGIASVTTGTGTTNSVITQPTTNVDGPNAILAHVTNPTLPPAPVATASAGLPPPASTSQMLTTPECTFTGGTVNVTAGNQYTCRIDQRGNIKTSICGANLAICATVAAGTTNALPAYPGGASKVETSAGTTCTSVTAAATLLVNVLYASTAVQTGTLSIYDVATATCTGAPVYVRAAAAIDAYDSWPMPLVNGMAYQWSGAAEVQHVFIGYY